MALMPKLGFSSQHQAKQEGYSTQCTVKGWQNFPGYQCLKLQALKGHMLAAAQMRLLM